MSSEDHLRATAAAAARPVDEDEPAVQTAVTTSTAPTYSGETPQASTQSQPQATPFVDMNILLQTILRQQEPQQESMETMSENLVNSHTDCRNVQRR